MHRVLLISIQIKCGYRQHFFGLKSGQDFDELPTDYPCTFTNFEATLLTGTVVTDFFKDGSDAFVTVVNREPTLSS